MPTPLLVLAGPTAVGKTDVALLVAPELGAEILSVDSRQIYRTMDIGTAKPTPKERARVRHHLIDLADPGESLSAGEFRRRFDLAEQELLARGVRPLAVGGSGLYLRAVTHGLFDGSRSRPDLREAWAGRDTEDLLQELRRVDPESAGRLEPRDRQRIVRALEVFHDTGRSMTELHRERPGISREAVVVALSRPREELHRRIEARVRGMIQAGLEDEARALWELKLVGGAGATKTVGYREWISYFEGQRSREEVIEEILLNSRRYAKRQMTWFRAVPGIRWVAIEPAETPEKIAVRALEALRAP